MRSGGQTRASSQTVVVSEREQRSLRSVRPASTSTIPHLNTGTEAPMLTTPCKERAALATEERPWKQRECQEQAHRQEAQRFGAGARDPSVKITRIEAIRGCSSRLLETSTKVRRATTGSMVNVHEHACDAKWVVCHAAVTVVLDRERVRKTES